ncbi:LysM peptidoglycan-binding domain-containing protein [Ornithinibacillus halophilus]|uniref:LysM repeat-containing protein n=1 Tax=Ornithinibacillus halophilus TaxID=930117 RepID=A0A1M5FTF4_9BACI|nr:LysM peptidoglycan-binding domain-containing protein [Ornithinibacillus halophilus]SHF94778.1 LysM repeat-containing protein [Ornithinibacillus halophilus]
MRRIYLSVTASAVILTACTTQQDDATPQDPVIPQQEQIDQNNNNNNGQLNLQRINQTQNQNLNRDQRGTAIDADEHFLDDISKFYDNDKFENDKIQLFIDGMHFHTKPSAFIDGDEVYIPLSFVSTHLEAGVRYDKGSNQVGIQRGGTDIELFIDDDTATVNGEGMETPSFIQRDGSIFVPICFVAEALGYIVEKNIEDEEVKIETHRPEMETFSFSAIDIEDMDQSQEDSIPVQSMNKETYTVQAGDSLFSIAKKYNTTVDRIKEINELTSNVLITGQVLIVHTRPSSYTVTSGDTLFSISKKFDLTVDQLQRYNQLTNALITPGQTLSLTQPSSYTVKAGDTLYSIAKSFNTTVENLKNWNDIIEPIQIGQSLVVSKGGVPNTPKAESPAPSKAHTVQAGDTLYSIAKKYNTTVDQMKRLNNLASNVISIGQQLTVTGEGKTENKAPAPESQTTYTVKAGDSLYSIANRFSTSVDNIKNWNNLTSNTIKVGQKLNVSGESKAETKQPEPEKQPPSQSKATNYTVVRGDTLLGIARRFDTTVDEIKRLNGLRHDDLQIGRTLIVSGSEGTSDSKQQQVTVSFETHTVKSGDNLWKLSIDYGIPMLELAKENNLSVNSSLSIGQKIMIPVYHVPVKDTVSPNHGELLDWWTEARYVFPVGTVATVRDVKTGRTFKVKHTTGGNHADSEPLTATDAKIMKDVWGGSYSWTPRAIIISVNGRKLAAAMHSYPHSISDIKDNNYNGHFCIHFLNSTRHKDGLIQESMQKQIQISAGVQ